MRASKMKVWSLGLSKGLSHQGQVVVAVDVRGIGLTRTGHPAEEEPGRYHQVDDAEEVLTYWAWHADECLFGMRVRDVLRSVDYALTRDRRGPAGCDGGWARHGRALGALRRGT